MATPPYNKYDILNNKLGWDAVMVVFSALDGVYSLNQVVNNEALWKEYFKQYANSESGDFYVKQDQAMGSLGMADYSDIAPSLTEAHNYFNNTVIRDGSIDESLFEFPNDGTHSVRFLSSYNDDFYDDFYEIQANYRQVIFVSAKPEDKNTPARVIGSRGTGDRSPYFNKLIKDIKRAPLTPADLITWLFATHPKAIEALKKSSEEILDAAFQDNGFLRSHHRSLFGVGQSKVLEILIEDKNNVYKERIERHKAGLTSNDTDPAGFGASRTWSEQCLLNKKMNSLARFHKGGFFRELFR